MIFYTKILRFKIAYFFNLAHACPDLNDLVHSRSKMCQVSCNCVLIQFNTDILTQKANIYAPGKGMMPMLIKKGRKQTCRVPFPVLAGMVLHN